MSWRESIFLRYVRSEIKNIAFFAIITATFSTICTVWHYDIRAVTYAAVLCLSAGAIVFFVGYFFFRSRVKQLKSIIGDYDTAEDRIPPAKESAYEREWREIALSLCGELKKRETESENKLREAEDYYTAWAHQVKVPISAMRLILQESDERIRRDMSAELTRVEQYADMIMAYVRLESSDSATDYVFREVKLDKVIKNVLRKYSGVFIRKKLTLKYEQTDVSVTGDEKWISFILEQLISNALKYTPRGEISVTVHDGGKISVSDSGIGIPREDLPRIFEKGYTGLNGRADERASGIGLYLIKRVCRSLGYSISVESEVGQGSTFTVDLSRSEIGMND